jgi:hypothetical protein
MEAILSLESHLLDNSGSASTRVVAFRGQDLVADALFLVLCWETAHENLGDRRGFLVIGVR